MINPLGSFSIGRDVYESRVGADNVQFAEPSIIVVRSVW